VQFFCKNGIRSISDVQKDEKSVLIKSTNAKDFYTLKSPDHTIAESCELATKARPVKIISMKET
jgi:ferredoxin